MFKAITAILLTIQKISFLLVQVLLESVNGISLGKAGAPP